ncbi:MAG: alpha/beta hydrolase, partial [Micromonosporaceae bacterium]
DACDAATGRLRSLAGEVDATQAPLIAIDTELTALADDLGKARGALLDALDEAKLVPATVSEDGTEVTYTGPALDKERTKVVQSRMMEVLDAIDDAVQRAHKADQAAAKRLAKLVPGYDPKTQGNGYVPEGDLPAPGTDPKKVNAWWDGLSPAEQQYLIHRHPDRIGRLDGVPVMYRDQANRVRLARERDKAEARRRKVRARLEELETIMRDGDSSAATRAAREAARLMREREVLDKNLRGIKAIEGRLYDAPTKPRAYLIGFEPGTVEDRGHDGVDDSDGRAIIAIGNPDTADHVATFVPGTGNDLGNVNGQVEYADKMALDAGRAAPDEDTAVIMWLGYDAPDDPFVNSPAEHYAEAATDDLRRFQDGLRATHEGAPSHNTVIGHSYGATVIGYAASGDVNHDGRPDGVNADELVFVGSPGVGVDRAYELGGVSPDHVWATRAEHDIIRRVPDVWFGTDPSDQDFGGHPFDSGPGNPDDETGTHSRYWEDEKARDGMAGIITGNYDRVPGYTPTTPPDGPTPAPSPRPAPTAPR